MTRLAELRALLAKATPGPWKDNERGIVTSSHQSYVDPLVGPEKRDTVVCTCKDNPSIFVSATPRDWHNAELIAAMHAALPALLDVVEAADALDRTFDEVGLVMVHDSKTKPLRMELRTALGRLAMVTDGNVG